MISLNEFAAYFWILLPLLFLGVACSPSEDGTGNESEGGFSLFSSDKWVDAVDQSFNLPIYKEKIPSGWEQQNKIVTNMQDGGYQFFLRDVYGPNDELVRDLGNASYFGNYGISLDGIIQKIVGETVQQPQLGQARPSPFLESLPEVQTKHQMFGSQGMQLQTFEIPFKGQHEGKSIEGVLYVMNLPYPQMPSSGYVEIEMIAAPTEVFASALETGNKIMKSRQFYAEYDQKKSQHTQMAMQRSNQSHQQRMAQRQASFNAHQQRMQSMSAASDARHQAFMNDLRSTPTTTGTSGYSSHNAFIDQIHEQTTFQDPYSGHQIQQSGQYDYWYTDGLGNYHGTNDPSFNPHSLQGNWQSIQPMNPQGW